MKKSGVFIVAEVGLMHNGSLAKARRLVDLARRVGADAVKFQTHIAEAETLENAPSPSYFKSESRFRYFQRTAFNKSEWRSLKQYCDKQGIEFMSSPFSIEAVELLDQIGMRIFKIPSGEVTNLPYLEKVAATKKKVFLSSGMSSWRELDEAVRTVRAKNKNLTVMQCTSQYPCPPQHVGLNVLGEIRRRYKVPVGLSDHTLSNFASYAAAALGAHVVEKHLVLSRREYGSDAKHSLEPEEFRQLVAGIRAIETMLAHPVDKNNLKVFRSMKSIFEKSLVTVEPVAKGEAFSKDTIGVKKPGGGLPPKKYRAIIGSRAKRNLSAGVTLRAADVQWK